MQIKQKTNWLGQRMEALLKEDLAGLFEEIADFRATGVLHGDRLRAIEKDFSDNVSHGPAGESMRLIEDAILFEMGRRFHNDAEPTGEWLEYTGEDAGFHYCSRCHRAAFSYMDGDDTMEFLSDHCPDCGAKLKLNTIADKYEEGGTK